MTDSDRQSWDIGRFLRTLDFFGAVPLLNCLKKMFFNAPPPPTPPLDRGSIFDFQQASDDTLQAWGALDDVVMGGVSASALKRSPDGASFSGKTSTANSGGFASIRTRNFEPPLNLSGYTGIELHLKGDGQRYKFFLRDGEGWDSTAYSFAFDTVPNQWITVRIPFTETIPVFRAKTVIGAPPLDPSRLRSLQIMLSKFEQDGLLNPHFQAGEFSLVLRSIRAY